MPFLEFLAKKTVLNPVAQVAKAMDDFAVLRDTLDVAHDGLEDMIDRNDVIVANRRRAFEELQAITVEKNASLAHDQDRASRASVLLTELLND